MLFPIKSSRYAAPSSAAGGCICCSLFCVECRVNGILPHRKAPPDPLLTSAAPTEGTASHSTAQYGSGLHAPVSCAPVFRKARIGELICLASIAVKVRRQFHILSLVLFKCLFPIVKTAKARRSGTHIPGLSAMQNGDFLNLLFHYFSSVKVPAFMS